MKTLNSIRSMAAIAAVIFAIAATGCQKENEITPNNNPTTTVSFKPKSIVTTKVGNPEAVRTQTYEYDGNNKLLKFLSVSGTTRDSLFFTSEGMGFIRRVRGDVQTKENLRFNPDKSLKELSSSSSSGLIRLTPDFIALPGSSNTLSALRDANHHIGFSYLDGNLKSISVNTEGVNFTYYNNLGFQKGINEIPVESTALMYHKLAEQEGMTNYSFSSKLIHTITATDGGVVRRINTFSYVQDTNGRVTTIFETVDSPSSGAPTQQFQHTIAY